MSIFVLLLFLLPILLNAVIFAMANKGEANNKYPKAVYIIAFLFSAILIYIINAGSSGNGGYSYFINGIRQSSGAMGVSMSIIVFIMILVAFIFLPYGLSILPFAIIKVLKSPSERRDVANEGIRGKLIGTLITGLLGFCFLRMSMMAFYDDIGEIISVVLYIIFTVLGLPFMCINYCFMGYIKMALIKFLALLAFSVIGLVLLAHYDNAQLILQIIASIWIVTDVALILLRKI